MGGTDRAGVHLGAGRLCIVSSFTVVREVLLGDMLLPERF